MGEGVDERIVVYPYGGILAIKMNKIYVLPDDSLRIGCKIVKARPWVVLYFQGSQ